MTTHAFTPATTYVTDVGAANPYVSTRGHDALELMRNSQSIEALHVRLANGSSGWLIYCNTKFTLRSTLSHLSMHTEQGHAEEIGTQLLSHLHTHYPHHDTYAENIHENDPHLTAFQTLGYFTNFSRVEMRYQWK